MLPCRLVQPDDSQRNTGQQKGQGRYSYKG